jgi:histidinol-phosphate aminotransferase
MDDRVALLVRERERLRSELDAVDGLTVYPSGANFVLLRVHGDGHALWQRLVDRGVLVRNFSRWPRLDECLRVTVGTPDENDAFLAALREAVAEVRVA